MDIPLTLVLDRARTDWLAGDTAAWARYVAGLRQLKAPRTPADRPRVLRRPRRPRAQP